MKTAEQNILVCLSASPSSKRVIRAAAKQYDPQNGRLTALYVSDSAADQLSDPNLRENIELAEQFGAQVHTVESGEIALSIAEYARRIGATDLFIGYSAPSHMPQSQAIHEKLLSALPDTDIHIIPDARSSAYPATYRRQSGKIWNMRDLLIVIGVMTLSTLVSYWFDMSRYSNSNIVTVYILAVLIASVLTSHRIYGIIAAVLYILLFNFLFIDPRFTLLVYDSGYLVTYFVTLLAALITGSLAVRMKNIARVSARNAYQAQVLLDTGNQLEKAADRADLIRITCTQISSLLRRDILFCSVQDGRVITEYTTGDAVFDPAETEAVCWTYANNRHSGWHTSRFSGCAYMYLSVFSGDAGYGVLGIRGGEEPLVEFENSLLLAMINEFALALNNEAIRREKATAEINAEKEQFRAGLLRSVSHDLRTPLTSIYGNADTLALHADDLSEEDRRRIYEYIRDDAYWLKEQMENILSLTRLGNSEYLHLSVENIDDVIEESLKHLRRSAGTHPLIYHRSDEDLFAEMDPGMIVQVLVNLIVNALKYTPDGTPVTICSERKGAQIVVSVADEGDGIPDADKEHIFELYYTGKKSADSSRSLGIGLNLCAMIMKAHGGTIEVHDNVPHGAVFTLSLNAKETEIYE